MRQKVLLWIGFLLACGLLLFGLFVAQTMKFGPIIFWSFVLMATGYKLFFNKSQPSS